MNLMIILKIIFKKNLNKPYTNVQTCNSNNWCISTNTCRKINRLTSKSKSENRCYLSKGAYQVWQSENGINIPVDSNKQDLIERVADVHLKEGRPLIILPRESPFNLIHLNNMTILCKAGAKIIPCIPAWYSNPKDLDQMIDFMVVRLFDSLGYQLKAINRWESTQIL